MFVYRKGIIRTTLFVLLGLIVGFLGIFSYTSNLGWKNSWEKILSLTTGIKKDDSRIANACTLDQKSEAEQIFFMTCGGIY